MNLLMQQSFWIKWLNALGGSDLSGLRINWAWMTQLGICTTESWRVAKYLWQGLSQCLKLALELLLLPWEEETVHVLGKSAVILVTMAGTMAGAMIGDMTVATAHTTEAMIVATAPATIPATRAMTEDMTGTLIPPGVTHMAQVAMVVATVATNAAMIALMTGVAVVQTGAATVHLAAQAMTGTVTAGTAARWAYIYNSKTMAGVSQDSALNLLEVVLSDMNGQNVYALSDARYSVKQIPAESRLNVQTPACLLLSCQIQFSSNGILMHAQSRVQKE